MVAYESKDKWNLIKIFFNRKGVHIGEAVNIYLKNSSQSLLLKATFKNTCFLMIQMAII